MPNKTEIRIGGSGGQGVVFAARILGKAAAFDGKNVVQTQAHGAEPRGTLAKSEVIISDTKIGFPAVRRCDILLAMTQDSLNNLLEDLKDTGLLMIDSTNVKLDRSAGRAVHQIPATEIAKREFGDAIYANMVMLGALTATTRLVSTSAVEHAIRGTVSKRRLEINIGAFRRGLQVKT